jgi:hypothetical protein
MGRCPDIAATVRDSLSLLLCWMAKRDQLVERYWPTFGATGDSVIEVHDPRFLKALDLSAFDAAFRALARVEKDAMNSRRQPR